MNIEAPTTAPEDILYRCEICGIESAEAICFAALAKEGPYRLQGTCITCRQPAREIAAWRRAVGFILLVAGPPAMAFKKYPCVLAYRSTRALLLSAADRAQEGLALLEYMNYDRGSLDSRFHREAARSFAFRRLGRDADARLALAAAFRLKNERLPYLRTLGLIQ